MRHRKAGFTLIELLVAVVMLSIVMAGVVRLFSAFSRQNLRQDADAAMEDNLRTGMNLLTDAVRNAGYGVPGSNLASWVTWTSAFTSNPKITGGGSGNDTVSAASATAQPVTTLAAHVDAGATDLPIGSTTQVNTGAKSLLLIGDSENALVTRVAGGTITIDTDPSRGGLQGLARAYPEGTPIYRVDVVTFRIVTDATGLSQLQRDENQGGGAQPAADGITGLALVTVTAGKQYQVVLTARSINPDPLSGVYRYGSLRTNVVLAQE
jgi:prepilin-type N-terminal cleavage/methylation domain-containing protein